jgi:hypothetical protein
VAAKIWLGKLWLRSKQAQSEAEKIKAKLWQNLKKTITLSQVGHMRNKYCKPKCGKNQTPTGKTMAAKLWLEKVGLRTKQVLRVRFLSETNIMIRNILHVKKISTTQNKFYLCDYFSYNRESCAIYLGTLIRIYDCDMFR